MVDSAASIWRDHPSDGIPSSGVHDPEKAKIREFQTWVESAINAGTLAGPWKETKAALDADLAHDADTVGFVYTTSDIGTYVKSGASGSGSWTKILDFIPGYQTARATDDGNSTANAWTMDTSPQASTSDGVTRIWGFIPETNTSPTVTITLDGGTELAVKTQAGNNPAIGGLVQGGPFEGVISGSGTQLRLLSDQASTAIQTAAEAAQAAAEAAQSYSEEWANKAEDSPVSVAAGGDGSTDFSSFHWERKGAGHAADALVSANQAEAAGGAAGMPVYADTTAGLAGTSNGEYFQVPQGDGTYILYLNDTGSATEVHRTPYPRHDDPAALIASTEGARGEGAIWETKNGFSYEEAASGASDHHLTTAGGVKLYVLANAAGEFDLVAFGNIDLTGATDATTIVKAAMAAAAGDLPSGYNRPIRVPAGDILLQESGVFSYKPAGASSWGYTWHGAGWLQTRFLLDPPSAANAWLYDSAGTGVYVGCIFNDIGFSASNLSGNQAYANGFNIEGTSGSGVGEGAFRFNTCMTGFAGGFRDWMNLTGTINAAEIKHIGCQFRSGSGRIVYQDNAQSVNIDFISCDLVTHTGDVFQIKAGGVINVVGGAWQWESGYLVNAINTGNDLVALISFTNIKTEMRDADAKLVKKSTDNDGRIQISFNQSDLSRGIVGGSREYVEIAERAVVIFNECSVPTPADGFRIRELSTGLGTEQPGQIQFNQCRVGKETFGECILIEDQYGVARARGCYSTDTGTLRRNYALDFDINWQYHFTFGALPTPKYAVLKDKDRPWPYDSNASGDSSGNQEHTVLLPEGAIITGARVYKPAASGAGTTHQIKIGNDDKSTTYASSSSAAQSSAHVIDWSPSPDSYVHVGTTSNERTVRLWADPSGATLQQDIAGEIAIIEYY